MVNSNIIFLSAAFASIGISNAAPDSPPETLALTLTRHQKRFWAQFDGTIKHVTGILGCPDGPSDHQSLVPENAMQLNDLAISQMESLSHCISSGTLFTAAHVDSPTTAADSAAWWAVGSAIRQMNQVTGCNDIPKLLLAPGDAVQMNDAIVAYVNAMTMCLQKQDATSPSRRQVSAESQSDSSEPQSDSPDRLSDAALSGSSPDPLDSSDSSRHHQPHRPPHHHKPQFCPQPPPGCPPWGSWQPGRPWDESA